jgi:hypothetical protein
VSIEGSSKTSEREDGARGGRVSAREVESGCSMRYKRVKIAVVT